MPNHCQIVVINDLLIADCVVLGLLDGYCGFH